MRARNRKIVVALTLVSAGLMALKAGLFAQIGVEKSIPIHLQDGEEFTITIPQLISFGQQLFTAMWTDQEGQGRPLTKGTGKPLSDPTDPLVFPRNFNRISAPETNSCSGCHNKPFTGGGGDIVGNVFVLGQRFDFATFDHNDTLPTKGAADELGNFVTFQTISNSRKTVGMNGSGFIEMLARQMTADLVNEENACAVGASCALSAKGVSFGTLIHKADGTWNTSRVTGLVAGSLATTGTTGPSLIIRPFHQASNVISIREFTNNAFNHHHGIQSEERFGINQDCDNDGFVNEVTKADMTAITLFQVTLAPPGRVIPRDPAIRAAIIRGEATFEEIGCASCHIKSLPLGIDSAGKKGWVYTEPNPYNPCGNLRLTGCDGVTSPPGPGDFKPSAACPSLPPGSDVESHGHISVDLTERANLPQPRLKVVDNVVRVPAYTDLKVHNMSNSSYPTDPNCEPCDQNQTPGSTAFFEGNCRFITRKLWGIANQHSFGHHGQFTTMRDAITKGHAGEAQASATEFNALSASEQNNLIEFLKSLQILTPRQLGRGTISILETPRSLCVDEEEKDIECPPGVEP